MDGGMAGMDQGLILRIDDPGTGGSVVLDDDGRVAYAYLRDGDKIVSDVWLYNVMRAPADPEWTSRDRLPFMNAAEYVKAGPEEYRLRENADVHCDFRRERGCLLVDIYVDHVHVARLESGAKPGWSLLAARPGPLARPLVGIEEHG